MATYDQGGGCPCGLYKKCICKDEQGRDLHNLQISEEEMKTYAISSKEDDSTEIELISLLAQKHGYILIKKDVINEAKKTLSKAIETLNTLS